MATRSEATERASGDGSVNVGAEAVARVHYDLVMLQEILVAQTLGGYSERTGRTDIKGSIEILDGSRNLTGRETLTLKLQDGRHVDFLVVDGGPHTGRYSIVGTGDIRES